MSIREAGEWGEEEWKVIHKAAKAVEGGRLEVSGRESGQSSFLLNNLLHSLEAPHHFLAM